MTETTPQFDSQSEKPETEVSISDNAQTDPHANTKLMDRILQKGTSEDLIKLLDSGFDINQEDWQVRTALMLKVAIGDVDTVDALLQRGADINHVFMYQDRLPLTALDTARQTNRPALAKLLESYGAKSGREIIAVQSEKE